MKNRFVLMLSLLLGALLCASCSVRPTRVTLTFADGRVTKVDTLGWSVLTKSKTEDGFMNPETGLMGYSSTGKNEVSVPNNMIAAGLASEVAGFQSGDVRHAGDVDVKKAGFAKDVQINKQNTDLQGKALELAPKPGAAQSNRKFGESAGMAVKKRSVWNPNRDPGYLDAP